MSGTTSTGARAILLPLALAQFLCSYAGSSMNVMINDISTDLNTTVQGVQVASRVDDPRRETHRQVRPDPLSHGRTCPVRGRCDHQRIVAEPDRADHRNSILEGVGTALLIPPVYILTTLFFTEMTSRARAFGAISAMGGIGAAAGPLLGGLITATMGWRAAFGIQALIIVLIVLLARRIKDPLPADPTRPFDTRGAVLSALGLVLLVTGILATDTNGWVALALIAGGVLVLAWFYLTIRTAERAGREPLLSTALFRNRTSNLGMVTQNTQWLLLSGVSFVVAAYLQVVMGYDAIQTGVIFTAETGGLLVASLAAGRLARRFAQRGLIITGFPLTIAGILLLVTMGGGTASVWAFVPGLLLIGLGLGLMLTPSVNVVQSSFGDAQQGEISGLSRSLSNLGSSMGTAIAGTILVAGITTTPERGYGLALIVLAAIGGLGLIAAVLIPTVITPHRSPDPSRPPARRP
jgi:MFS family permease